MTVAFTPGPWHVQSDGQIWSDDHPVAEKITTGPWGDEAVDFITGRRSLVHHWGTVATDEAKANARLIAAAPSLYADAEFLCARIRELEGEMTDDDELSRQYFGHVLPAVARMESALAEARGNSKPARVARAVPVPRLSRRNHHAPDPVVRHIRRGRGLREREPGATQSVRWSAEAEEAGMSETRHQIVDGIAYVIPRSEPDALLVRRIGQFGVGVTLRWSSCGIGFDILRAGILLAVGPAFFWIAHIERQLGEPEQSA